MNAAEQRSRAQAADWVVRLSDEEVDDATRAACEAWCAEHPSHARLLAEMRELWGAVTPQTPVAGAVPTTRRRAPHARRALGLLALVPVLLLGAWALPWHEWAADQRTGIGELRRLTLADGSRLVMNGDSAVDIDLSGEVRQLRLLRGEVYVEVAKAAAPFEVLDRDGSVRALGTRYAVRRDDEDTLVTVTESRVRISPRAADGEAVELGAGEQLRFDGQGITRPPATATANALAWQQGRLVFDDAPLPEVLRELARYRPGLLLADDPALQDLRFTGVLPTAQSDAALELLGASLPLRVLRVSPWLVRVSAAGPTR